MKRGSFTLFELMIVVLIMVIIYSMVLFHFKKSSKKESFSLYNLKTTLLKYFNNDHLTLVCENECQKCLLYKESKLINEDFPSPFKNLSKLPAFYRVDLESNIQRADFLHIDPKRADNRVCFRYDIYPNSSSSEIVVENEKGVLYIPPYFEKVKKFDDLQDFRDYLENLKQKVVQ